MDVVFHPDALSEYRALIPRERRALQHAIEKLELEGIHLPFPHSSAVQGTGLRELRPRSGRSAWRAIYQRVGDVIVIVGVGPEAVSDPRGFRKMVVLAEERLAMLREQQDGDNGE